MVVVVCFGIIWFHIWFLASYLAPHQAIRKKQPEMEPNIWSQSRLRLCLAIGSLTRNQTWNQATNQEFKTQIFFSFFSLIFVYCRRQTGTGEQTKRRTWYGHIYRVSQKKVGLVFRGHFRPLWPKIKKKARKQTPPKIQFYLLGGVLSPVYNMYTPVYTMYTMLVSGICSQYWPGKCTESNIKQVQNAFS